MHSILFSYIGPETILPVSSALAAIGGVLLMFGGLIRRLTVSLWRRVVPGKSESSSPKESG